MNKQTEPQKLKGETTQTSAKCENNHSSPMSTLSCCDPNIKSNLLVIPDMCRYSKSKYQKKITFTPNHFELEGSGFKITNIKILQCSKKTWDLFHRPAVKSLATVQPL